MLSKPATMLLGLIHKKPINAYEIIRLLKVMQVNWWYNIADSTVYSTLKTLEKRGLIAGKTEKVGNMPDRTVYCLTGKGEAELYAALRTSMLQFDYDTNVFSVAAFFLDVFTGEEQETLLKERLIVLEKYRDGIAKQVPVLRESGTPEFHVANVLRMMDLVEAEISGTKRLLEGKRADRGE